MSALSATTESRCILNVQEAGHVECSLRDRSKGRKNLKDFESKLRKSSL
jgi:hypothetical protein